MIDLYGANSEEELIVALTNKIVSYGSLTKAQIEYLLKGCGAFAVTILLLIRTIEQLRCGEVKVETTKS